MPAALRRVRWAAGLLLALPFICGCPGVPGIPVINPPSKNVGSTFDTATALSLDAQGKAALSGNLTGDKVDVYDIGAVAPGDRVIVGVRPTSGSTLDPTAALFDERKELFALNDDADFAAGRVDSAIDDTVIQASGHFYLAITKFFFAGQGGAYEGSIEVRRGSPLPQPATQIIRLNFGGGTITIPDEGTYTFGAFNAADVDKQLHSYDGQTVLIKAKIVEIVKQNYRNTGAVIITNDDPIPAGNVSTIQFGAFSRTKFGVAQDVDQGNRNCCDDGIVFTDDFVKPFTPLPTAEGAAIAIANVAAHEAGHLLGLNHVADITDLMDTTGSASTLLVDQEFKTAVLSPTIFPFGSQNGPAILNRVIPKP